MFESKRVDQNQIGKSPYVEMTGAEMSRHAAARASTLGDVQPTPQRPEVPSLLDDMLKGHAYLSDQLDQLEARLAPILRSAPDSEGAGVGASAVTAIGEVISSGNNHLARHIQRVASMISRLAL